MNQEPTQAIVGGVVQSAPRVTIEQIEAEIESEHYFTAGDGVHGDCQAAGQDESHYPDSLDRTIFCVLVLKNGMRVEGVNHGSVSAANYSVEYGRKDAREKAIDKLWPMFGFELAQKLYREKQAKEADASSLGSSEGKFRKKPVVIDAVLWTGENLKEVSDFFGWRNFSYEPRTGLQIHTLEGTMDASIGDYIIKGVKGEFYPCKPDIFAATYEAA